MKKSIPIILAMILFSACNTKESKTHDKSVSEKQSLYFGLKPPGMTPELFAYGIVSTDNLEVLGSFSPNMDEFYFTRQLKGEASKNLGLRFENGKWIKFMEEPNSGEIAISPDNKTMYLGNNFRERTASGWSEDRSLGEPYEHIPIMRLTASKMGTYVFDERDSIGTIRISKLKDGIREEPRELGKVFSSGTYISHPFIAPDESYIIWDFEHEDGYGDSDLYISFRQDDGSWGPAINLGNDINSDKEDIFGSVTSDGKYFIFHRIDLGETYDESSANVYWVDAQAIMKLNKN